MIVVALYVEITFTNKPTEYDPIGSNGLYMEKISIERMGRLLREEEVIEVAPGEYRERLISDEE